jgi:hypothetical protein
MLGEMLVEIRPHRETFLPRLDAVGELFRAYLSGFGEIFRLATALFKRRDRGRFLHIKRLCKFQSEFLLKQWLLYLLTFSDVLLSFICLPFLIFIIFVFTFDQRYGLSPFGVRCCVEGAAKTFYSSVALYLLTMLSVLLFFVLFLAFFFHFSSFLNFCI